MVDWDLMIFFANRFLVYEIFEYVSKLFVQGFLLLQCANKPVCIWYWTMLTNYYHMMMILIIHDIRQ